MRDMKCMNYHRSHYDPLHKLSAFNCIASRVGLGRMGYCSLDILGREFAWPDHRNRRLRD